MRKLIVYSRMTLDDVMQASGGPEEDRSGAFKYVGWSAPYEDEVGNKVLQNQLKQDVHYLLARKTFEIFAAYWLTSQITLSSHEGFYTA